MTEQGAERKMLTVFCYLLICFFTSFLVCWNMKALATTQREETIREIKVARHTALIGERRRECWSQIVRSKKSGRPNFSAEEGCHWHDLAGHWLSIFQNWHLFWVLRSNRLNTKTSLIFWFFRGRLTCVQDMRKNFAMIPLSGRSNTVHIMVRTNIACQYF
jgi:hypothetical protein